VKDARPYFEANRRHWNEVARLHPGTDFYRFYLDRIRTGGTSLHQFEIDEVGDVAGKSLLHVQSHIGTETLSWARRGARVTAVDFSPDALAHVTKLAAELGVEVRCVESNVYELPSVLDETFDVVYTSWGVLGWMPDIPEWARIVSRYVRPGGILYVAEFHPMMWMLDETSEELRLRYSYFQDEPFFDEEDGSYADPDAKLENRATYGFEYPLSRVITSLIESGLRIELFHEYPGCGPKLLKVLVPDPSTDERWHVLPPELPQLPLSFSVRARKEE
jgi:2-polyprenyl-3-methyl-5-hydroxy-6-metoxy-1,4-benzoquinol methylase